MSISNKHRADLLLLLVTAFWGSSYYFMDLCLQELGPLNLNAIRFLCSSFFLLLIFFPHIKRMNRRIWQYSIPGAISLVFVYLGATYGVKYTSISNAGFIISLTVVFVPFFELLLFKKIPSKLQFISLILCVVGVGLLTLNEYYFPEPGDILCMISAIASAINLIITEKAVNSDQIDPIALTIVELATVGCIMFLLAYIFEEPHLPHSKVVWFGSLFLALICTGLAFLIQITQQKQTSASDVGLIYTFEPVFSAIIAFFFAGERLCLRGYIGAILMIVSLVLTEFPLAP